ncbi:MAG: hypothetical protein HRF49_08325 [bacterium]
MGIIPDFPARDTWNLRGQRVRWAGEAGAAGKPICPADGRCSFPRRADAIDGTAESPEGAEMNRLIGFAAAAAGGGHAHADAAPDEAAHAHGH